MRQLETSKTFLAVQSDSSYPLLTHSQNEAAFVSFVTAGYPTKHDTVDILLALEAGGADIIELGVPFSDPQADGPAIQRANEVSGRRCRQADDQSLRRIVDQQTISD